MSFVMIHEQLRAEQLKAAEFIKTTLHVTYDSDGRFACYVKVTSKLFFSLRAVRNDKNQNHKLPAQHCVKDRRAGSTKCKETLRSYWKT